MSFETSDEALKGGMYLQLTDDGASEKAVFLGEPDPREGTFKGKPRTQYVFPLATAAGLCVWTVGSRLYRALRDGWASFFNSCFLITRIGKAGSTDTRYEFKSVKTPKSINEIMNDIEPGEIAELMKAAIDIQE